jgi:hypothetical protein
VRSIEIEFETARQAEIALEIGGVLMKVGKFRAVQRVVLVEEFKV